MSFLLAFAPIVQSVSKATCISGDVLAHFGENSLITPAMGSDVRNIGAFLFTNGAGDYDGIRFPGFDIDLTLDSGAWAGISIDTDNASVAALVAALVAGLSGTEPCDAFGADLSALEAALVETLP